MDFYSVRTEAFQRKLYAPADDCFVIGLDCRNVDGRSVDLRTVEIIVDDKNHGDDRYDPY